MPMPAKHLAQAQAQAQAQALMMPPGRAAEGK